MIEKYYIFDVDRFLQDHDKNVRRLAELQIEKESVIDSTSTDYSRVRGSGIADPVTQKAQQRERIELEIKEYQDYLNAFDILTADLEGEELTLLKFLMKPKKRRSIVKLMDKLGYSDTAIYNQLNELREKLRSIAK